MNPRARRIDIRSLLHTLEELYQKGIDYVDIVVEKEEDGGQDTIGIYFNKSYMDEKFASNFDNMDNDPLPAKIDVKLTDKDLNDLI